MQESEAILREFHDRALVPRPMGMEVVFVPTLVKEILVECVRRGVGSLGVDGFSVFPGGLIQIHQEWCFCVAARASGEDWGAFVARSVEETILFIDSVGGAADGFSMVLDDEGA